MHRLHRFAVVSFLPLLLLAGCAGAPVVTDPATLALPADGPVSVSWKDPRDFREFSCRNAEFGRSEWVRTLAQYTRQQAARRLPAGARLDVRFVDIDRAGECEPTRSGQFLRVVRDIHPPRIELDFRLTAADGSERSGQAVVLTDLGFLQRNISALSNDGLHHEKRLIDDWLRGLIGG